MNRAEQYNQTIKRMSQNNAAPILPSEYQQVEYIFTKEGCYIQTSICNTTPIEFECIVKCYDANGGYVFGTTTNVPRYFVQLFTMSGKSAIGYGAYTTGRVMTTNVYYKLRGMLHNGIQTLYVDGVQDINATMTSNINSANIRIFGTPEQRMNGEIKYFKIWSNGVLVYNGISCYRKSDSKAGFFDTVSSQFYSSPTISNFGVGASV